MKKTILLAFYTCFAITANAQTGQKKWNYFADASFGFIPASEGFTGTSSLSIGATYQRQYGLGLALASVRNDLSYANGVGLEFRLADARWLLLKAQIGIIRGASSADNGTYAREFTYLPGESKPFYWRGTAGLRFLRILFVGISTMQTGSLTFRDDNPPFPGGILKGNHIIKAFTWQLGLSLPALPKRKKQKE